MKKLLLSTLVLCMAFCVSCSKNSDSAANSGDNGGGGSIINPGKRIYENYEGYDYYVYISHDNGETWEETNHYVKTLELHKVYHWDGKKLMSFDYYHDGQVSNSTVFEYNDAGLVTRKIWADISIEGEIECFYYNDNSQMIKFDYSKYYGGNVAHYWAQDVFWSNNKIDRIREADNNNANYTKYYWTNENLTKCEGYDHNSNYLGYTEIRYDNKNNPNYCGMSMTPYAYYGSLVYISKNNVLSQRTYNSDGDLTRTITFTYEYNDENFPIERYKTDEEIYEDNEGNLRKSVIIYHNTYNYLDD